MTTDQPDAMPVFVIQAKDKLALSAVFSYQMLCENAGLVEQADQVALAVEEIRNWQRRNPDRLQLPDHPHVPVEGSTPLDSPARPCGMHYSWPSQAGSEAGTLGPCVLDVADHHERHQDEHGNEWLNVQWALDRLDAAPAGEVVGCPACGTILNAKAAECTHPWHSDNRPAPGEPVPVPPPVDALLKLVAQYGQHTNEEAHGVEDAGFFASGTYRQIETSVEALWATGVEEGRRQLDAEIHASVLTSARLAAAEAGFGPAPESVTVTYDRTTDPQTAFDLGVAEGRRQAFADPVTIRQYIDSEEFKLALRKMVRTGEIRMSPGVEEKPAYRRGDDCPTCGASGDDRG